MIAAWASLTTGWALTHAWSVTAIFTALLVLGVVFIVIPLTREPTGKRNASRPTNPPWAGKARAWLRAAPRAVRGLPGAIGWAWRTPVRAPKEVKPSDAVAKHADLGAVTKPVTGASPERLLLAGPAPELHHEPTESAMLGWLRALRGPGWTVLALRRQLAVLGALTSGRVTPGHTAARPHGEPGHPAGDPIRCSGYCADGDHSACLANTPWECDCDCHKWDDSDYGLDKAAPVPAFLTAVPPPHDPALWQPRAADETDWSLLAVIAPDLAAERRDAQTQAGA